MTRTTNCLFRQPGKCGTDWTVTQTSIDNYIEWNGILQNTSKDKQFKTAGQFFTFCKVNVVITNYAKFSDLSNKLLRFSNRNNDRERYTYLSHSFTYNFL